MEPLLEFLLAATTATLEAPRTPVTVMDTLGGPPGSQGAKVAGDCCKKLLFAQPPDLHPAMPAQRDPAITGIMRAMEGTHTLTTEDLADWRAAREDQTADKWPGQVTQLCRLCKVDKWKDLPQYWQDAAGLKKGGGTNLALLQDQVNILAA